MQLISFAHRGRPAIGIWRGSSVIDLSRAAPELGQDMGSLVRLGVDGLARARSVAIAPPVDAVLSVDDITFLPVLRTAGKVVCLGLNYLEHAAEGGYQRPEWPTIFLRSPRSLTAHNGPILRPVVSEQLDYEAELAVVIGRDLHHISPDKALDHVYGYSCFNDASVRDYQRKTIQWTIGKNFDSTGAFGPAIVTADELPAGASGLDITCRLNGDVVQNSNTNQMIFPVADTLSLLSSCLTLETGDVVVMGTPSGVGHARKPPLWMRRGDIVEVEIERVGVLRNVIEDEAAPATTVATA